MWTLTDPDDKGCRVLRSDVNDARVALLPAEQDAARESPTRGAMRNVLATAIQQSKLRNPPQLTNDDLDRVRASLGGEPF